ncbi:MAG: EAL domain-containing protein [Pseudomonadota bacterium]
MRQCPVTTMIRSILKQVMIAALFLALFLQGVLDPLDKWLRDLRFAYDDRAPSGDIVLVDIDAVSIDRMGSWPWKRRVHGEILDRLMALGAAEVAFDVDFSSPSTEEEDRLFADALDRAGGGTILAVFNQFARAGDAKVHANQPIPLLLDSAWPGVVNVTADWDALIRTSLLGADIGGEPAQSIAALLADYSGEADGSFIIDYGIRIDEIDRISVHDLLAGIVAENRVKDRKVLVGAYAAELRDFFPAPRFGMVSGHMIQAAAAETLIQNRALVPSGFEIAASLTFFAILAGLLIQALPGWIWVMGFSTLAIAAMEASATIMQIDSAFALQTSAFHLSLLGMSFAAIVQEIDIGKLLLRRSETRADNTQTILDRVITDNFDGIVIINDNGTIHTANEVAHTLLHRISSAPRSFPETLNGLRFDCVVPDSFNPVIEAIDRAPKRGDEDFSRPFILDESFGTEGRIVLEYVVTPSILGGGVDDEGRALPDRVFTCISFRDITARTLAEEQTAYLARFDPITGLPNLNNFSEHVDAYLMADEAACTNAAICVLSVDDFQDIQDALGPKSADEILDLVADRIRSGVDGQAFLATLGQGKFLIFSRHLQTQADVEALTAFIVAHMAEPYHHGGQAAVTTASAGIVFLDGSACSADPWLRRAKVALNRAREQTGNIVCVFEPSMERVIETRRNLELDLWKALEDDEFQVYYQPQMRLSDGELMGAEALVRWKHPEHGFVSPAEFIPIAEQSNLIVYLGRLVLKKACMEAATWPKPLKIAVNLSPRQFFQGNLKEAVATALEKSELDPERLDLEVTEGIFIEEGEGVLDIMQHLRARRVGLALDDFGTGYSSLSYLHRFPLNKVKIDQVFLRGMTESEQSLAIIRSVAVLARDLGMETVVEGIESREHEVLAKLAGCTYGQGYFYGKPQSSEDLVSMMTTPVDLKKNVDLA